MLILKDTIYHTKAISGFGTKKEFDGNELENKKVFEEEKNSIWYLISMPDSGYFSFDIKTQNPNDDWDFLLYEYKKKFCKRIEANKIEPIRTNLSRSPKTGLSFNSKSDFVGAGINENYSRVLKVNKGEQYVLVVNNPKRAGGNHTLILHFPHKKVKEEKQIIEPVKEITTTKFELVVKDKITQDLVKSNNISITGMNTKSFVITDRSVYIEYISKKNRTIHISVSAKGYMLYDNQLKVSKNKSVFSFEILLEPINEGSKVNLKQIQFYGNRFDMLPSAKPSLKALLQFMKVNPTVKIEIEGHVNGPKQRNSKSYQQLSYNRAYAVKDYLVTNGIDKDRIDYKGYGNTQMLYPDPKSEYQESANRRVEIKILSK
jgi:outer membrane protein OmpA-like peptidoglycan-associated protein